jgi:DNA-binding MarR family transcriptional regulator
MTDAHELAGDLRVVLGRLVRRMRAERDDAPLSLRQVTVLGQLDRNGRAGVSDLAAGERVRPQSMAATVASLLDAGLVERHPDPADGRRVLIDLSAAGRDALAADRRRRIDWLANAIERDLTPREQSVLVEAATLMARLTDGEAGRRRSSGRP